MSLSLSGIKSSKSYFGNTFFLEGESNKSVGLDINAKWFTVESVQGVLLMCNRHGHLPVVCMLHSLTYCFQRNRRFYFGVNVPEDFHPCWHFSLHNAATTLTGLHFATTTLLTVILKWLGYIQPSQLPLPDLLKFVLFANFSIVGMNVSLMWNSVGFYQVSFGKLVNTSLSSI